MLLVRTDERLPRKEMVAWAMILFFTVLVISLPFFSAHHVVCGTDLAFHLGRIEGIAEGLRAGQFPVRVNPIQLGGYGMPTGIFYPDVFLYFPALLLLVGVPLLAAWDALLVVTNLMTAFAGWWGFAQFARSWRVGAIAALFYLGGFFRLIMMYDGSNVAMALGMAFLPAALAAIWTTLRRDASCWPAAVVFSVAILLSHILTSMFLFLSAIVLLAVSLPRLCRPDVRRAVLCALGFAALLSLWFYAPFLYFHHHMDYVMKGVTHQEVLYATIHPLAALDGYIGSSIIVLLLLLAAWRVLHPQRPGTRTFWLLLLSAALLVLVASRPEPWQVLGTWAGFLQFPIRIVVFATMAVAMAAALGLSAIGLDTRSRRVFAVLCTFLVLGANALWLLGYSYAVPIRPRAQDLLPALPRVTVERALAQIDIMYGSCRDYMDTGAFAQIAAGAASPEEVETRMRAQFRDRELHPGDRIVEAGRMGNTFDLQVGDGPAVAVQLPLFWYDGYTAEGLTGASVSRDAAGRVSLALPPAGGTVRVRYAGLPWFHWTDLASLCGLFCFLYVARASRRASQEGVFH